MAGMAGAGAGFSAMGGTLGGIGDIISALGYKRPKLPQPGGQEQRLRDIVQNQIIGGGLESAAGMNLYNQILPMLYAQIPGMTVTPNASATTSGAGGTAGGGTAMQNYQTALANYNQTVGRNQQIQNLQAQLKSLKGPTNKPQRQATQQQLQTLKQQRKGGITAPQAERAVYQGAANAPTFGVDTSGSSGAPNTGSTDTSGGLAPSTASSLAAIMGYLHGSQGMSPAVGNTPPGQGGSPPPDFGAMYSAMLGTTPSAISAGANQPISQPTSTP